MNRTLCGPTLLALCLSCAVNPAWAAIGASGGGGLKTTTNHQRMMGRFTIDEDVAYDPSAGNWIKRLSVMSPGADSGEQVPIIEELTNTGTQPWTDWHENVIGPVENFGFGPATIFAFERQSVDVFRNGVGLVEGVDYTLTFTEHPVSQPNQPNGVDPGRHWQGFSLFFGPSGQIGPSDTLRIEKNIFETYLNGDFWNPMVVAEIAEYPTVPEPAAFFLAATTTAAWLLFRRRRACE
jgi:hypothetical protein